MARTLVDLDETALALAQQQLGTTTKKDTVNRALAIAAGLTADERERGLAWLQDHADQILDFDALAAQESSNG